MNEIFVFTSKVKPHLIKSKMEIADISFLTAKCSEIFKFV
jgi:hypothetical protein